MRTAHLHSTCDAATRRVFPMIRIIFPFNKLAVTLSE
jgi:hypothetical protein